MRKCSKTACAYRSDGHDSGLAACHTGRQEVSEHDATMHHEGATQRVRGLEAHLLRHLGLANLV